MAVGAALLAACTPGAFAQSIGVNFTSDGNDSGIAGVNNAATNTDSSMLPTDLAGAAPYAQMNWNNLGKYGGVNPAVLTNSAGNTVSLEINWDSGGALPREHPPVWAHRMGN